MNSRSIKKRSLLIGLISIATLICLFAGFMVYSKWVESRINDVVRNQVLEDNIQTAKQLTRLFQELGISSIKDDENNWNRAQDIIEDIKLPNGGYVCIVDNQSGFLVCHPDMRENPKLRQLPLGNCLVNINGNDNTIISSSNLSNSSEENVTGGVATFGNETHVIAIANIPELEVDILVHQRESGIHAAVVRVTSPLQKTGFAAAVVISLLIALVNFWLTQQYENKLADVNESLEQVVDERTQALMKTRNAIIFGLAKLAESRDTDTGQHLNRIRSYVTILANQLGQQDDSMDEAYIEQLALASSLHDIGKVGIPDQVLLKPGRFTPEERTMMETHSTLGGVCLHAIQEQLGEDDFLSLAKEIAFFHHERWDGTGYPAKLKETKIPISARIVALADVYDALTSKRPYKKAMSHEEARNIILEGCGSHFDPAIVEAFTNSESEFIRVAIECNEEEATLSTIAQMCKELEENTRSPNSPMALVNS